MKTFFQTFTVSIASGVCIYVLYYGVLWAIAWLLDMSPRSVSYDQQLLIEEIGYWSFVLAALVGGVMYWKVYR